MFEKIEDYYIARVSKLENINYGDGNLVQEKIQKFVCVKKKDNQYKDLITNELYEFGINYDEISNKEYIDSDYSLMPLSEFINVSDSEMLKENLIKIVSVILNELNEKLINNDEEISKKMI